MTTGANHPDAFVRGPAVRVLATNDFVGSFFPQRTSYGALPGVAGLAETIATLRAAAPSSVWVDSGDIAQGCPLNPLSDGTWGWQAADQLGIDVAALGNHELDWGLQHLQRWRRSLPFELLAANLEVGLPGSKLLEAGDVAIGVIGLTEPRLHALHPDHEVKHRVVELIREHATRLRRDGAWRVVLAIHDGVDETVGGLPGEGDPGRMRSLCNAIRGDVDLVIGGHTLMRYVGELAGVPFLQPWAFGSEVAWADLSASGGIRVGACDVSGSPALPCRGQPVLDALRSEVVGFIDQPLIASVQGERNLAVAIATGVLASAECDSALVAPWDLWTQPPRDGISAFIAEGPVSRADVLRAAPLCGRRSAWGGQLLAADWRRNELHTAVSQLAVRFGYSPIPADDAVALVRARRRVDANTTRVAVLPFYAPILDEISHHAHVWHELTAGVYDALEAFLRGAAPAS